MRLRSPAARDAAKTKLMNLCDPKTTLTSHAISTATPSLRGAASPCAAERHHPAALRWASQLQRLVLFAYDAANAADHHALPLAQGACVVHTATPCIVTGARRLALRTGRHRRAMRYVAPPLREAAELSTGTLKTPASAARRLCPHRRASKARTRAAAACAAPALLRACPTQA
jgi:hypothetical protein